MCFVRGGGFVSALVPRSLRGNGGFGRAQTEIMRRTISDGGGGVISRQSSPDLSSAPRSKRIKGKCIPKKKKDAWQLSPFYATPSSSSPSSTSTQVSEYRLV